MQKINKETRNPEKSKKALTSLLSFDLFYSSFSWFLGFLIKLFCLCFLISVYLLSNN